MSNLPDPDGYLSASDVKDVAEEVIAPLPLPGVEGSALNLKGQTKPEQYHYDFEFQRGRLKNVELDRITERD